MKNKEKCNVADAHDNIIIKIMFFMVFLLSCAPSKILPPEEALKFLSENDKKPVIIDLREVSSFATGHIKGAENIPFKKDNFLKRVSSYDRKAPILIYCGKGLKTSEAALLLKQSGFNDIYTIEGGFESWKNMGYEISE